MPITGLDRGKSVQSTKRVARGEIGIYGSSEVAGNGRAAVGASRGGCWRPPAYVHGTGRFSKNWNWNAD
jgi:hypothetical protein